jgi:hypothetical protein
MVIYHEASDGLICPLQDAHGQLEAGTGTRSDVYKYVGSTILLSGVRFKISRFEPEYPWQSLIPEMQYSSSLGAKTVDEMRELWDQSAMAKHKHFCTLNCLLQPAITRTCAQIRAESLAMFYAVNSFHLEMDNFALVSRSTRTHVRVGDSLWQMRSPIDWWRAVRDTNLRHICRFSIAAQSFFAYEHNALMISYDRLKGKAEMAETYGATRRWVFKGPQEIERQKVEHAEKEERLRQLLELALENGLCVAVLEEITRLLERKDRPYFRSSRDIVV